MHKEDIYRAAAQAAHETNTRYSKLFGEHTFTWDELSEARQKGVIEGVRAAVETDITPAQQHELWRASHLHDGWTYGPTKDPATKTHPCLVDYDQLPPAQRAKDELFQSVVRAFCRAAAANA